MNLKTLLTTLESTILTRRVTNTPQGEVISYYNNTNTPHTITINNNTYNNLIQLCLLSKNDSTYLYINHTLRRNLKKFNISNISSIVIT